MSLINQMLQELDARGTNAGAAAGGVLQGQIRAVPERGVLHPAWWVVLAMAIFLGAAATWIWLGRGSAPTPAQKALLESAEVPLKLAAELGAIPSTSRPAVTEELKAAASAPGVLPATFSDKAAEVASSKAAQTSIPALQVSPAVEPPPTIADKPKAEKIQISATMAAAPSSIGPAAASPPVTESTAVQSTATETNLQPLNKQVKELTPQQRAENEYRRASTFAQQGRVAEAIPVFESALLLDAQHAPARQALVALLIEVKRQDEAARRLREGLQLDPSQVGMAMILARLQVDRGELKAAIDTLQRSSSYAADRPDYQAFLAALLQRDGHHKEAIERYALALKKAPQNGIWWMGQGISLQAENRTGEAIESFSRAKASSNLSGDLRAYVEEKLSALQR